MSINTHTHKNKIKREIKVSLYIFICLFRSILYGKGCKQYSNILVPGHPPIISPTGT